MNRQIARPHFAVFLLIVQACTVSPPTDTSVVETSVAGTLTALPSPTSAPTITPAPTATPEPTTTPAPSATPRPTATTASFGTVEGTICFPSEVIPAMTAYFQETAGDEIVELSVEENQATYSIKVPAGNYQAYAWLPDFAFGGSYSNMVPCGLQVGCNDHSLIIFAVAAGETTSGVDICDWYGGPGSVPYPPGLTTSPGAISGLLSYPSEAIPPLRVVAFNTQTGFFYFVDTRENQATYLIEDLPPGIYHVVAYFQDLAGGYSAAVPCGLTVSCTDHSLLNVSVTVGRTTTGIDPADWYAPPGAFPANPAP